jgi:hypothetical protein
MEQNIAFSMGARKKSGGLSRLEIITAPSSKLISRKIAPTVLLLSSSVSNLRTEKKSARRELIIFFTRPPYRVYIFNGLQLQKLHGSNSDPERWLTLLLNFNHPLFLFISSSLLTFGWRQISNTYRFQVVFALVFWQYTSRLCFPSESLFVQRGAAAGEGMWAPLCLRSLTPRAVWQSINKSYGSVYCEKANIFPALLDTPIQLNLVSLPLYDPPRLICRKVIFVPLAAANQPAPFTTSFA